MRRKPTEAQKQKSEERRARFRTLAKTISDMTDAQRSELASRIIGIATVEGRALSHFNTCLVASQCPTATLVGGFRQWIKAGRSVRKGEHGMMIWCPVAVGKQAVDVFDGEKNEGEHGTRFIVGTVFDVSQTDCTVEGTSMMLESGAELVTAV